MSPRVHDCPTPYRPRRPAETPLYRVVQTHFETFRALCREGWEQESLPGFVEEEFRRYLKCGILAYGFARAYCAQCGRDFLIAFSCKGRGVCPSCNARRSAATAAHLVEYVIPRVPVRQWVLSLPKRLRYFLRHHPEAINSALHIFLHAIESYLRECSPDAGLSAKIGAVVFIQRFGSAMNDHIHFHCVVFDGLFDVSADENPILCFHEAMITASGIEEVQKKVRRRILRAFVRRGFIDSADEKEMLSWEHGGGFSIDASRRVEADERGGLERLLRYCARPPFALERIEQVDSNTIIYHLPKPDMNGCQELRLTPFELLAKITALVPPPRTHLHRYFGVLAPNAPLRAQVVALAQADSSSQESTTATTDSSSGMDSDSQSSLAPLVSPQEQESKNSRSGSHSAYISWAMLLARIYEVFPLLCPYCGGTVRIISFITETPTIHHILNHIGEPTEPPKISPARGPPWEEQTQDDDSWDSLPQPEPDYEFDQTVSW